jgi:hypothetical protein
VSHDAWRQRRRRTDTAVTPQNVSQMKINLDCLAFFTKCCVHTMSVRLFACHLVSGTKSFVWFSWNSVGRYVSSLQKFVAKAWFLCRPSQWRILLDGVNKFIPVISEFIGRCEWNSVRKMSEWERCTNRPVCFMKISAMIGILYLRDWMTFCPVPSSSCTIWIKFDLSDLHCRLAAHGYHDRRWPTLGSREN